MNFIIREYQESDLRSVSELISRTFTECNFSDNDPSAAAAYADFFNPEKTDEHDIQYIFQRASIFLVAETGQQIAGAIRGNSDRIFSLYVDTGCQRKGIGSALVNEFEKRSVSPVIYVRSQIASVSFYLALGYSKTGEIQKSRGLNIQPMEKNFS